MGTVFTESIDATKATVQHSVSNVVDATHAVAATVKATVDPVIDFVQYNPKTTVGLIASTAALYGYACNYKTINAGAKKVGNSIASLYKGVVAFPGKTAIGLGLGIGYGTYTLKMNNEHALAGVVLGTVGAALVKNAFDGFDYYRKANKMSQEWTFYDNAVFQALGASTIKNYNYILSEFLQADKAKRFALKQSITTFLDERNISSIRSHLKDSLDRRWHMIKELDRTTGLIEFISHYDAEHYSLEQVADSAISNIIKDAQYGDCIYYQAKQQAWLGKYAHISNYQLHSVAYNGLLKYQWLLLKEYLILCFAYNNIVVDTVVEPVPQLTQQQQQQQSINVFVNK